MKHMFRVGKERAHQSIDKQNPNKVQKLKIGQFKESIMKYLATMVAALLNIMPATAQENEIPNVELTDIEIMAQGPEGNLSGSYINAGRNTPIVLIIAGSGPTDRDGNNPLGVKANSYKLLAEALAKKNISTVRTDKRGMFGSKAALADANAVTIADYANDTHKWAQVMIAKTALKCIWVAGHSEGGLVALVAAQKADNICGIITIASVGRPLDVILREQLDANPANAPLLPDVYKAIDALKAGNTIDISKMHPALQNLFNPAVQPFLIDLIRHDPAALTASIKTPLLVIQGDNDLQIKVEDAKIIHNANQNAKLSIIKDMNHILKTIKSKDRNINLASYANPNLPISSQLVEAITEFVKE